MSLHSDLFNASALTALKDKAYRLVETQEVAATLEIVDTLDEQYLLEELLDDVKPVYRKGTEGMHYMLKTAFRYPPLKWGSRFGTVNEPSFFYASTSDITCLYESGFYRFILLDDMKTAYDQPINSEHSMFYVLVSSSKTLDLTQQRFQDHQDKLRSPIDYSFSKSVGRWATNDEVQAEVIKYNSARYLQGVNLAVAEPGAIRSKEPQQQTRCLCQTTTKTVTYLLGNRRPITISREHYLIDGKLPKPA